MLFSDQYGLSSSGPLGFLSLRDGPVAAATPRSGSGPLPRRSTTLGSTSRCAAPRHRPHRAPAPITTSRAGLHDSRWHRSRRGLSVVSALVAPRPRWAAGPLLLPAQQSWAHEEEIAAGSLSSPSRAASGGGANSRTRGPADQVQDRGTGKGRDRWTSCPVAASRPCCPARQQAARSNSSADHGAETCSRYRGSACELGGPPLIHGTRQRLHKV